MYFKKVLYLLILLSMPLIAQINSYVEDFNDGILTGWEVSEEHQRTFELAEEDGILKINYHRTANSDQWDNFNFTPGEEINVSDTPTITVKVKSEVGTVLTFKPIYGNGSDDWLQKNVPSDNQWHDYTFDLSAYGNSNLTRIYFYLDGGSTSPSSGQVCFEDMIIGTGEFVLKINNLSATALGPDKIELDWTCNDTGMVDYYNIYRDQNSGIICDECYLFSTSNTSKFSDTDLTVNTTYYYRVTAVDTSGLETDQGVEVFARTFQPGEGPSVYVHSINTPSVGVYDKFEINVGMENSVYDNPYDPEEIDLAAIFTSPSDSVWVIYGFYDDYQGQDQWKIRFSPNETGTWSYYLTATDMSGSGQSESGQFQAIESSYHGWIRPSKENSHYFEYDDGSTFYGVGTYNPWNMDSDELDKLKDHGGNVVGFWNIMYDQGDIIESMNSGLGKYDQPKCGRIDQIIGWAEEKDLKAMFAIWPHDLISNTVWAHQWHQNPYNSVCGVNEFYSSDEAWDYQEKQYRYLIARWGYSRGLGIWELVNEINGTDGWQNGFVNDAEMWTKKVSDYFRDNDPFRRPTTASQSGGIFWENGYEVVDVPNMHMYETQAMTAHYPSNPMRSSMYVYQYNTQRFWNEFDKPAIFGEAGYTNSYGNYAPGSSSYTTSYHNSIWSSWANGISMTPIWWAYGILSDNDLVQMKVFSEFINVNIEYLDFAHVEFEPLNITASGCDAFGMTADTMAFGWIRETVGNSVTGRSISVNGLLDITYSVNYFNTWTGDLISVNMISPDNGVLNDIIPDVPSNKPDVAFVIKPAELGVIPYNLKLSANPISLLNDGESISEISCIIKDEEGRFCGNAVNEISFSVIGSGTFTTSNTVTAISGKATINYQSSSETGIEQIIVTSPGLLPDTIEIEITNQFSFDDFENYESHSDVNDFWKVKTGTQANIYLEKNIVHEGSNSMKFHYNIGNGAPPYSTVYRAITQDLSGFNVLGIWYKPAGTNRELIIRLSESSNTHWEYGVILDGYSGVYIEIPVADFKKSGGSDETIDMKNISEISLNVLKGEGEFGSALLFFDSIKFLTTGTTSIDSEEFNEMVTEFALQQNYPNPFNPETNIEFQINKSSNIKLQVFDMRGNLIETLINEYRYAGNYRIKWNAEKYPSGIYIYKLNSNDFIDVKKCVLLK